MSEAPPWPDPLPPGTDALVRLFHRTTPEAAATILARGFRDVSSAVAFGGDPDALGVYLSVWRAYDENQGAKTGPVLCLDMPAEVASAYYVWEHWEELGGWVLYEAFIPADVLNRYGPPRYVDGS